MGNGSICLYDKLHRNSGHEDDDSKWCKALPTYKYTYIEERCQKRNGKLNVWPTWLWQILCAAFAPNKRYASSKWWAQKLVCNVEIVIHSHYTFAHVRDSSNRLVSICLFIYVFRWTHCKAKQTVIPVFCIAICLHT